jgi:hypothetical protein
MAKKEKSKKEKTVSKKEKKTEAKPADLVKMQQLDGKNYNKKGVKSLDELLEEKSSVYSTADIKEYEADLNKKNTSDLQAHAARVGVLPKEDRRLLIKILLKQFAVANSSILNQARQIPTNKKPISQEALDILAEGR